jgi:hypothetical protein
MIKSYSGLKGQDTLAQPNRSGEGAPPTVKPAVAFFTKQTQFLQEVRILNDCSKSNLDIVQNFQQRSTIGSLIHVPLRELCGKVKITNKPIFKRRKLH